MNPMTPHTTSRISLLSFSIGVLLTFVTAVDCPASPLPQGSAVQLFAKGNELYMEAKRLASEGKADAAKAKFAEAEVSYQRILDGGFVNWQILYNLGNALYQEGALGKAIACYRRAQRLAPRQEDILINLERAKAEARDKEALPAVPGLVRTLLFPYYRLNVNEVTVAGFLAYAVFGALLVLCVFVRANWLKALCGIALAATLTLGATLAAKVLWDQRVERGVVVSEVCAVRFGPGPEYEKRFEAHEGAELVVLARHKDSKTGGEWLKVRMFVVLRQAKPAGTEPEAEGPQTLPEGWVEAKGVETL